MDEEAGEVVDLVEDLDWGEQDEGNGWWPAWRCGERSDGDVGVVQDIGMRRGLCVTLAHSVSFLTHHNNLPRYPIKFTLPPCLAMLRA